MSFKLLSWNVNGLRAIYKKGFVDWMQKTQPDVLCLQETKAAESQLPDDLKKISGYHSFFCSGEKPGYSGVAIYSKEKPLSVSTGIGIKRFDSEGRILIAEFKSFILCNIYFPNGKMSNERLKYKLDFYDAFLEFADKNVGKNIVICGDFNTAHTEIDLARPKENQLISGFLQEERAWIDKLISHGFIDTFRMFSSSPGNYSYWDMKTRARERNVGWRIDYFFVNEKMRRNIEKAFIWPQVMGSDHCPVGVLLEG